VLRSVIQFWDQVPDETDTASLAPYDLPLPTALLASSGQLPHVDPGSLLLDELDFDSVVTENSTGSSFRCYLGICCVTVHAH
jgi:hypothetical protein